MPTKTTALIPPPLRNKILDAAGRLERTLQNWLFSLQNHQPLKLVDTSGGNYSEALPPAGLNSSTGQSNQNQELVYKKVSADGNTFTLTGALEGPQTLIAQWSKLRVKSNGTSWYVVG
jgi:hypothetical protein